MDRFRLTSLRAKMLAVLIPIVLVVITAMLYVTITRTGDQARGDAYANAQQLAATQARAFDSQGRRYRQIVDDLKAEILSYKGDDRPALNQMVGAIASATPEVNGLYVELQPNVCCGSDRDWVNKWQSGNSVTGRFVAYWDREHGHVVNGDAHGQNTDPVGNENWYGGPRDAGHFVVIEPYVDPTIHVLMTSYVTPIFHGGTFWGVSGLDVALGSLEAQMSHVHVLRSGYAFIVSNSGTLVTSPKKKLIGHATLAGLAKKTHEPGLRRLAALVHAGRSGHLSLTDPFTGKSVVMFASPVQTGEWSVITVAPEGEMMAASNHLRDLLLVIGLIALIILVCAIIVVATRIGRSVTGLAEAADRIAEGDLDVEVTYASRDEVGRMADAFRRMVGYLQRTAGVAERVSGGDLTVEIEPASDSDRLGHSLVAMRDALRRVIAEIGDQSERLADQSQQLAATAEETGQAVSEIARALEEVASGAEQQVTAVTEAQQNATAASQHAEEARSLAAEGGQASDSAAEAMTQVRESSDDATRVISELSEASERIGGIIATITEIADQTNLLALNAAIEAARAGDHGRGFAVVAEEVRRLSEQTGAAAASIGELVESIQVEARRAADVISDGAIRSRAAGKTVEGARQVFDRIAAGVSDMTGSVEAIAAVAKDVVHVAEAAAAASEQVSASTQETSASTQQISSTAQELAAAAELLQRAIAWFRV